MKFADDQNPYMEPFANWVHKGSAQDDLVLVIEHGPWLSNQPGTGDGTETGILYPYNYVSNSSFEDWTLGAPDSWISVGAPVLTENVDPAYIYHGDSSIYMNNPAGLNGVQLVNIPLENSTTGIVKVSAKVFVVSGEARLYAGQAPTPTTTYATYDSTTIQGEWITLEFWKATFDALLGVFVGTSGAAQVYFDDVRVERYFGNVNMVDNRSFPRTGTDDCHTINNAAINTAGALTPVGWDNGLAEEYNVGLRFQNIPIPQGTIIRQAWIDLHIGTNAGSPIDVTIDGEDVDNASTFSTIGNYNGRPRTTASVAWSISLSASDQIATSPNLAPVIQEIVDRALWASGNSLVLFINDATVHSANHYANIRSYEDGVRPPPTLYYILDQETEAQSVSILPTSDHTYVANKQNDVCLSHIFRRTSAGVWSSNLLDEPLPYDLLVGGNGDITYFGITDSALGAGPFASLVFNTDIPASSGATLVWEYYDSGTAWTTIPNFKDWTDDGTNGPFTESGLISLHFDPPSTWTSRNLFTEHGGTAPNISGLWIRIRQTAGALLALPQQQTYDPYTITWPYTEIQNSAVLGDIPAISELVLNNLSDGATATARMAAYKRMMIGTRSVSLGEDFRAYINCSDVQVPSFMSIALTGASTTFISKNSAPTGKCVQFTAGGGGSSGDIEITIKRTHAEQFFGKFRIYLRVNEDSGAPVVDTSITFNYGKTTKTLSTTTVHTSNDYSVLDFGEMTIPSIWYTESDVFNDLVITIDFSSTTTVVSYKIYDLILFPMDGVVIDTYEDPSYPQYIGDSSVSGFGSGNAGFSDWTELVVDSLRDPRKYIRTYARSHPYTYRYRSYIHEENSGLKLDPNERMRIWFFGWTHPTAGTVPGYAHPTAAESVEFTTAYRYIGLRGKR